MAVNGFNGRLVVDRDVRSSLGTNFTVGDGGAEICIGFDCDLGVGISITIGSQDEMWEDEKAITIPLAVILEAIARGQDDRRCGLAKLIAHLSCQIALLQNEIKNIERLDG